MSGNDDRTVRPLAKEPYGPAGSGPPVPPSPVSAAAIAGAVATVAVAALLVGPRLAAVVAAAYLAALALVLVHVAGGRDGAARRVNIVARLGTAVLVALFVIADALAGQAVVRFGEEVRTANGAIEAVQTDRALRAAMTGDVETDRATLDRALSDRSATAAGVTVLSRSADGAYNVALAGVHRCISFDTGTPRIGGPCEEGASTR